MKTRDQKYYKQTVYRRKLKSSVSIIISIFALIVFGFLAVFCFNRSYEGHIPKAIYYNETSDLDYKVYLKENDIFETEYLEKDMQYVASLIDHIDFLFNYNFNSSAAFDYNYKYYAVAKVVAYERSNPKKVLYTKEETILPEVSTNMVNSSLYSVNKLISIDYGKYNDLVGAFKKNYILSLDSTLTITFYVTLDGTYKEFSKPINKEQVMTVEIPLSEQTVDIKINYNKINNANIIEATSEKSEMNIMYFSLCIVYVILEIIIVVKLVRLFVKLNKQKTYYSKALNKIMKEYDSIIVKSKNIPSLKDYNIIEVESFEELLDAREGAEKSILHIELRPNLESLFVIINNQLAYIYILKEEQNNNEEN